MADRLIVALDVDSVGDAQALVERLDGTVRFFKIGLWLLLKPGANDFIDRLVGSGSRVFLDYKMYDIGETVRRGVQSVADRGISFVTVHGDKEIMQAAVAGRAGSALKILAVSVLTSLGNEDVAQMGYGKTVQELVHLRVRQAAESGCDGVIASPTDSPDELRQLAQSNKLLVVTPGIRMPEDTTDDHARAGHPADAICHGADYLVVGRPIVRHADPAAKARRIIAEMQAGQARRLA